MGPHPVVQPTARALDAGFHVVVRLRLTTEPTSLHSRFPDKVPLAVRSATLVSQIGRNRKSARPLIKESRII